MPSPGPVQMRALGVQAMVNPPMYCKWTTFPSETPRAGQVRIRVHAGAFNPADWAVCLGSFPYHLRAASASTLPRVINAIGEDVTGVSIGDLILHVKAIWAIPLPVRRNSPS